MKNIDDKKLQELLKKNNGIVILDKENRQLLGISDQDVLKNPTLYNLKIQLVQQDLQALEDKDINVTVAD